MSGLEAFSMVCNVMTVISFGLETAKLCSSIRKSGSSDPELLKHAHWIRQNSEELLSPQGSAATDAEKRLQAIASECLRCAKDIEQEVSYTSPKKAGFLRAMKSTVKTVRRKSHLDQLKERLETSRNTMNNVVIGQILKECIASKDLNRSNYDSFIQEQKAFIVAHDQRSQIFESLNRHFHDNIKETIVTGFKAIEDRIEEAKVSKDDQDAYEKLLGSLYYPGMNERKTTMPEHLKQTFEWIFDGLKNGDCSPSEPKSESFIEPELATITDLSDLPWQQRARIMQAKEAQENQKQANFLGWLESNSGSPYWISGKPGSGKSTLMRFIMTDRRTRTALERWRSQPDVISHFLWKPGSPLQKSLQGMLCSLLHQTLNYDIGTQLLGNTPGLRRKKEVTDWNVKELKAYLSDIFQLSSNGYLIILDGLDELTKPHGGMDELFNFLDMVLAEDRVKLCVSSRPERIFELKFSGAPFLRMQDVNFADIQDYTLDVLKTIDFQSDDRMEESITYEILSKADGVFIWAHLVLQSVKNGINEFDEKWENVYKRILALPPDLTELYKDMWSRMGANSEIYIKQAALYFQIYQFGQTFFNSVACLAVASDEKIIGDFTEPFEGPDILDLVRRCEHTQKTLSSVSSGLLYVGPFQIPCNSDCSYILDDMDEQAYHAMDRWDFQAKIRFTHRTAADFLDSDDGEKIFGSHRLSPQDVSSRIIKAGIILGQMGHDGWGGDPNNSHLERIFSGFRLYREKVLAFQRASDEPLNHLLSVFHRCADKIDIFKWAPGDFSSNSFFAFTAAYYGFLDYVDQSIPYEEDDYATSALLGACGYDEGQPQRPDLQHQFIQDCLKKVHLLQQEGSSSAAAKASENIVTAWRCFLLHEIQRCPKVDGDAPRDDATTEAVIEAFLSAGVLKESPSPTYLVEQTVEVRLFIPSLEAEAQDTVDQSLAADEAAALLEVNDEFLLRVLAGHIGTESTSIIKATENSIMRPILAQNGKAQGKKRDMFTFEVDERSDKEAIERWFDEDFYDEELREAEAPFPCETPSGLTFVHLGAFSDVWQALRKRKYNLSDVNRHFVCWHRSGIICGWS